MSKLTDVFVYGTLKEGFRLDRRFLSETRTKVQKAEIDADLFNLGWFPTIKAGTGNSVRGEVHSFPETEISGVLDLLDRIEGVARGLYSRKKVKATLETGKQVDVWVYEYNGNVDPASRIESGIWEEK